MTALLRQSYARLFVGVAVAIAALAALPARAQTAPAPYPSKPIRLVVGFAPGGAADYVSRTVGEALGKALGQAIVIENKAGAGSSIAADLVAKSPPDGYTLLIASPSSISVNPALNPKLSYSARDLAPVGKVTSSPLVIAASPASGIASITDLIAKLNAEINKALADPEMKTRFAAQGVEFVGGTPEQAETFMRDEGARWGKVIKATGMKAD